MSRNLTLIVTVLAGCSTAPTPTPPVQAAILAAAGDVKADSAWLWARASVHGPVEFRWFASQDSGMVAAAAIDPQIPVKVELAGLRAGTQYSYSVTDAAGCTAQGRFRTAAAPGYRDGLRFGVSGDWRGDLSPYPAISNLPARQLDFFVALGDTVYSDVPSPALNRSQALTLNDFRIKHLEIYTPRFGPAALAEARASTAWFATIDDHEITNDIAGGAPPSSAALFANDPADFINGSVLYLAGMQAFQEYHPQADEFYSATAENRMAGRLKLYRARHFGSSAAIFLLDARSFRDEPIAMDSLRAFLEPQAFVEAAFEPGRTMLGREQFELLKADLIAAEMAGVTWKFVLIPEPIQNLGPILASDRYEGYAAERTELLRFIEEHRLRNVVFVAADIHCTIINNLTYQTDAASEQIALPVWEITTGAVAYDAPFGPTVVNIVQSVPVFGHLATLPYQQLDRVGRDALLTDVLNQFLDDWGYDRIGLEKSSIPAELLEGGWTSLHSYGWTEFEISPGTEILTVTTYGVDWYSQRTVLERPDRVVSLVPKVVSRLRVEPR